MFGHKVGGLTPDPDEDEHNGLQRMVGKRDHFLSRAHLGFVPYRPPWQPLAHVFILESKMLFKIECTVLFVITLIEYLQNQLRGRRIYLGSGIQKFHPSSLGPIASGPTYSEVEHCDRGM